MHIIELNFKPNTETTMSIPLPVYNQFVEWLNENMGINGIKGNDVMGGFINIYEKYRHEYLGALETLKPSSYVRYASVLFGFWRCLGNYVGFKCQIKPIQTISIIEQNKNVTKIESEVLSRGYYIKPIGKNIIKIIDKAQENLLTFVK